MKRKILRRALTGALGFFSTVLTIIPESMFSHVCWLSKESFAQYSFLYWIDVNGLNIAITRIIFFIIVYVIACIMSWLYSRYRSVEIQGGNYSIVIEYGDLLKKDNCQRVINFDECFTTTVGNGPADIKGSSVCGQYLKEHPNLNIDKLVNKSGIKACKRESKYKNKICYSPGSIVPNGDDLLMAFTKLESTGISKRFTVNEYLKCLDLLWQEIDKNYCNKDVCILLLGSGIARFDNGVSQSLSKEEIIDLIVSSYKLSQHKLKSGSKLHIVCKRSSDFSMDSLGWGY